MGLNGLSQNELALRGAIDSAEDLKRKLVELEQENELQTKIAKMKDEKIAELRRTVINLRLQRVNSALPLGGDADDRP